MSKSKEKPFHERFKNKIDIIGKDGLLPILKRINLPIIHDNNIKTYSINSYQNNHGIKEKENYFSNDRKPSIASFHSDYSANKNKNSIFTKQNKLEHNKISNRLPNSKFKTSSELVKIEEENNEDNKNYQNKQYNPISYNIVNKHKDKQQNLELYTKNLNEIESSKYSNLPNFNTNKSYSEYKPYTVKQYKEISKNFSNINTKGLGANIGTEEWNEKQKKLQKLKDYSTEIKGLNKEKLKKKELDLQSEVERQRRESIENSKRLKALRYSGSRFYSPRENRSNFVVKDTGAITSSIRNNILKSYNDDEDNNKFIVNDKHDKDKFDDNIIGNDKIYIDNIEDMYDIRTKYKNQMSKYINYN